MDYRRWPRRWKVAYWVMTATLVAGACVLIASGDFGESSASSSAGAPNASDLTGIRGPGATRLAATTDGHPGVAATTTTTTAPEPQAPAESAAGPSAAITVPTGTLVATLRGDVPGSPSPGATANQTVPGSWYGYPSILPVVASDANWLEVRLAQRPNESTAWIPASAVSMSIDRFAIVVDLASMQLSVFKRGRQIEEFPAGIGKPSSPTPPGNFFVTMTVPPPSPGYGPVVLVTSAHSDAITDWENSGDAIIAIHGPIDARDDALIGTTGAAISNGCVRLHDADLARLSNIPPGTPVEIVSS